MTPTDLASMETGLLRSELARGIAILASDLLRLSQIWAELERRGEDLSPLRIGMGRNLPLIAAGLLDPKAVVAFAGKPSVLRALEGVPLDEQRRLAEGGEIKVIDPTNPARVQSLPLASLPAPAVRRVFADGHIRTPDQQRLSFRPPRRQRQEEETDRRYQPRYDRETGLVAVGKMRFALADLIAEVSSASGPDYPLPDQPDQYLVVKGRLSPEENERFLEACRKAALPDWEMIRKALRAFGLI